MNKKVVPVSPGKKKPPSGRVYSTYDQKYQKDPDYMDKQVTRNRDRRKAQEDLCFRRAIQRHASRGLK